MFGGCDGTAYLTFLKQFRAYSPSSFFYSLESYVHCTFSALSAQQRVVVRGGMLYHYGKGGDHEYGSLVGINL
jgi:hypothetical protein